MNRYTKELLRADRTGADHADDLYLREKPLEYAARQGDSGQLIERSCKTTT
jgi:hypothetical protein